MVSVDVNKMVAIRTASGSPEEVTKLLPGDNGFAYAIFPSDGARHQTDTPNLYFSLASKSALKAKAKAKGSAKAKSKAKGKSKAKAKAPPSPSSSESGEEEECEGDEEVLPTDEDGDEAAPEAPADEGEAEEHEAEEELEAPPGDDEPAAEEPPPKKLKQESFFYFMSSHLHFEMRPASTSIVAGPHMREIS